MAHAIGFPLTTAAAAASAPALPPITTNTRTMATVYLSTTTRMYCRVFDKFGLTVVGAEMRCFID